ncbi:hypothetical protein B0H21DRAFT_826106 [Amylocystis lapponica]|nr:hypothetical protein B0H21DRAFT_826106 [Amylocystis lapponica]
MAGSSRRVSAAKNTTASTATADDAPLASRTRGRTRVSESTSVPSNTILHVSNNGPEVPDNTSSQLDTSTVSSDVSLPSTSPAHRAYETRVTNDPHPAVTAGFGKRQMVEITADAERKREEKEAQLAQKRAELEVQRAEYDRKIQELAEYEKEMSTQSNVTMFNQLLEQEDLDSETAVVGQASPHSSKTPTISRAVASTQGTTGEEKDGSDGEAIVGTKRKASGKATGKKTKKTKRDKREELRSAVDNAKTGPAVSKGDMEGTTRIIVSATGKVASTVTPKPTSVKPTTVTGLKANWRSEIRTTSRLSSPASSAFGTPTPKSADISRHSRGTPIVLAHRRTSSAETVGGFTDQDVSVAREDASNLTSKHKYTQMAVIDEDTNEESNHLIPQPKRRAKTAVPGEKSMSFDSLPEWVKPKWKTAFIPTVLDIVGSQENPWELDRTVDVGLLTLLQDVLDMVYPEAHEVIDNKSKIFRIARQAVCDWRRGFLKAAHTVIKNELERLESSKQIRDFVKAALIYATGHAFWKTPGEAPSGALQSYYILKTFAVHLSAINGSQVDDEVADWPRGALALTTTAVEHEFGMWCSGNYKQGSHFREDTVGDSTARWARTSVRRLTEKPDKFTTFIKLANQHIEKKRVTAPLDDDRDLIVDRSSPAPYGEED